MAATEVLCHLEQLAQRVLQSANHLLETLSIHGAEQWKALAQGRFEILQALDKFVSFKQERILLHVIQNGDPVSAKLAKKMSDSNYAIQTEYDDFVRRWPLTSPYSVEGDYNKEVTNMMLRIAGRVALDVHAIQSLIGNATLSVLL